MAKSSTSFQKGHVPWDKDKSSWNRGEKCPETSERMKGNQYAKGVAPPNKGKKCLYTSERNKNNNPMNYPEFRAKLVGAGNGMWRGGKRMWVARRHHKRRMLGLIPLNQPFDGSVGHHVDKVRVINIPEELHKSIQHSIWSGKNMKIINQLAWDFMEMNVL